MRSVEQQQHSPISCAGLFPGVLGSGVFWGVRVVVITGDKLIVDVCDSSFQAPSALASLICLPICSSSVEGINISLV